MVKIERMCAGYKNHKCSNKSKAANDARCKTCAAIFREANNADPVIQAAKVSRNFPMQTGLLNIYIKSSAIAFKQMSGLYDLSSLQPSEDKRLTTVPTLRKDIERSNKDAKRNTSKFLLSSSSLS